MSYSLRAGWHIPSLCVQWKTADDGQRNCPKHVEFYSKNKFEKLVQVVGFIIRRTIHSFTYSHTSPQLLQAFQEADTSCAFQRQVKNNCSFKPPPAPPVNIPRHLMAIYSNMPLEHKEKKNEMNGILWEKKQNYAVCLTNAVNFHI